MCLCMQNPPNTHTFRNKIWRRLIIMMSVFIAQVRNTDIHSDKSECLKITSRKVLKTVPSYRR